VYGTQVLINLKKGNQFLKSVFVPSFISIILALIFVPIWKGFATAVIYLVAEVTILVMMVYHVRKNGFYLIIDKYI
jgi:O-antigen/teichoic acid export membrane protein